MIPVVFVTSLCVDDAQQTPETLVVLSSYLTLDRPDAVVLHRRHGDESFPHPRLPYAVRITHHVCVTLTPTARRLHTLKKRPCFHTSGAFPGICVHLSVCGNLRRDAGRMQTQTYVRTCRGLLPTSTSAKR